MMIQKKCGLNLNRAGKELSPHGTLDFPCAGYSSHYKEGTEENVPWHWHEELEMVYIKEGNLKLQVPGKTFYLKKGEGAVINSNILHYAAAEPDCHLLSLVFHPLLITGKEDSVFSIKYVTPLLNCPSFNGCSFGDLEEESVRQWFITAFDAFFLEEPGYEFVVRERLSDICIALWKYYEKETGTGYGEPGLDGTRMRKMMDYIHHHFSETVTLAQVAEAADIGERECLRCFQRTIQISPMQYLLKYRVTQAASMLLRNQNYSVSEISSRCGFESPSNFSQMFKRYFKTTPREYKKRA